MKYPRLFGEISIGSLILILMAWPAQADCISDYSEQIDRTDSKTLLAQSLIVITRVQLQETPDGIEVILETANGEILQGTTLIEENNLIVDIPNAQLQLLEGQEFYQENPIEGIATISITESEPNSVRITVTGIETPPDGKIIPTEGGLILSLIPPIAELVIVSTAEKRPENVQNIPISVTVITQQQIEDADVRSLRDAAALTPNFFTSLSDRSFNFQTIRGLGNSNYLVRDAISVYIDDVPYENIHQFLPGELFDLERIEILRGPQGTLYGRSSQAGVINIISRPPSDTLEVNVGGGYGNYNQRQAQLSVSDTPIQDKFGYRLAFAYNARDGFTKNILLDEDANEQSSLYGRANFVWKPSEEWTISFNSNVSSNQDGDNTFVPITQSNPFESQSNIPGYLDVAVNTQALRIGYEGETVNVTSITARNDTNLNYQQDTDYTADDLLRSDSRIPSTIWSQEIRVQSPESAERFSWLLGGYLSITLN